MPSRLILLSILIALATHPAAALAAPEASRPVEEAGADPVIAEALAALTDSERIDDFAAARALRRHLYSRLPVAGVAEAWITDEPIRKASTLSEAMALFRTGDRGVWCQAAAVMLARLYEAAGYRAWVASYGDPDSLSHAVTLVEIRGRLYLQDAYFNLDYVRADGSPLPYYELLQGLTEGRSPRVRQDLDHRLGVFSARAEAQGWNLPGMADQVVCDDSGVRCTVAMTLGRFQEVYYKRDAMAAFLKSHGEPARVEYLMLHPLWTTGPHYPTPSAGAARIQARVEAITRRAGRG